MYHASQGEIGQHDKRVCLAVGAKLLYCHTNGYCCIFEMSIPCLALDRDLLTKNFGLCFQFYCSLNKAPLTEASDTSR